MKRFLALSRTTHGILDIAAPAFCALLWLGRFPSWQVIILSFFTAFAGYTAVYALNDLVGVWGDREKFAGEGINPGYSVEASVMRYPLAQNLLSYRSGFIWFAVWFLLALAGSYLLNPFIILVLLAAALLEVCYCFLFKVTYWRTLVSGLVKASGPLAAILVVNHNPPIQLILLQMIWLILWEIGGQNIPADWNDVEEDRRVSGKTIPLQFGAKKAGMIVIILLALAVIASLFLQLISPMRLGLPYLLATILAGYFLLLQPAVQLYRSTENIRASRLFDRASYYPLTQLAIIAVLITLS
jgi:4-hydroxybenzoate polyprenyltransferase